MVFLGAFFSSGLMAQDEMPNITENVLHRLKQLNHRDGIDIFAVGKKGDRVYALPVLSKDGTDSLLQDVLHNKKLWKRNLGFWTWLSHGRDAKSWRTPKRDSLQVTIHHPGTNHYYYEVDLDYCAPHGVHDPVMSVCHVIVDVGWNKLTDGSTNQLRIERGLGKIDAVLLLAKEGP